MFTGIIEELGTIENISGGSKLSIKVKCNKVLGGTNDPTKIGDSISVNGICLTVTEIKGSIFTSDVMPETVSRTSLAGLGKGSKVNLERAAEAGGRLGGHIVSGHIDGTGTIKSIKRSGNAMWFEISAPPDIKALIAEKGSVAIDGISLTVAEEHGNTFKVSVIPHTMSETVLEYKKPGDIVNIETDIIGKYVKKLMEQGVASEGKIKMMDKSESDLMSLM